MKKYDTTTVLSFALILAILIIAFTTRGRVLPFVYHSGGVAIRYPDGYSVDPAYTYTNLGPGKDIHGVKFTIPKDLAAGTNLSSDSYLSVETLPIADLCEAKLFLDDPHAVAHTIFSNNLLFSVATSTGAAAGNRYEEQVYAVPESKPCHAIRYFIHSTVLENYTPGMVREYNRDALIATFDKMRASFTVLQ